MHIEPGAHVIRVAPNTNILAAALAAGIALPHSCRAGRCASCKARLTSGAIQYPNGSLPPGITAAEAADGQVLLCQAQARSDLHVRARGPREPGGAAFAACEVISIAALGAMWQITLRRPVPPIEVRPGQFVDMRTADGAAERVAVVAISAESISVEAAGGFEVARGGTLLVAGPYEFPR